MVDQKQINLLLQRVIDLQKEKSIREEYHDKISSEEVLGIAISKFSEWDGGKILDISKSAFEDSNFHLFADKCQEVWDRS